MSGHRQISRVRWGESDKQRLLDFRDSHPDWSWEAITEIFPGRSATGLCKMYSDLKKIKREEEEAARMANNDEETEEMENNDDEATEEMADQENNDEEASEEMENNDDEATEEMAINQNEGTNTAELSKENKRSPDPEEDNEAPPRKQPKTGDVAANDDDDPDSNSSEDNESRAGNIKVTLEVILAPHQLPISFVAHVTRS